MSSFEGWHAGRSEGVWTSSNLVDPSSGRNVPEPSRWQSVESDGPANWLPSKDRGRFFLHQLSQTLTSLHGILELALLIDSDAEEYRRVIQQSLAQAEGLMEMFKAYRALISVGRTDLMRGPVRLDDLVLVALELLRPLLDSRGITVQIDAADDCVVQTYPVRLLMALRQGLLGSIQESSPGGKLEVGISTQGGSACVSILAVRQGAESGSLPGLSAIREDESQKALTRDNAEGDWALVRKDVEALGGNVQISTAEASHVFCEICLPQSRHEGS